VSRPFEKVGLHVIEGYPYSLGQPRVVTLTNPSVEYVRQVRERLGPLPWIVVRWILQSDDPNAGGLSPTKNAQMWLSTFRDRINATKAPRIVYQGLNEPATNWWAALLEYETTRMAGLHDMGAGCALYSPSVGRFPDQAWTVLAPLFSQMDKAADVLNVHEYWADATDISASSWYCARWRWFPELVGVPIVVSECGRDVIGSRGRPGWKKDPNLGLEGYLEEIAAYNDLIMDDKNVIGATLFTVGNDDRWSDYDASDPYQQIVLQWAGQGPDWELTPPIEPPDKPSMAELIAELDRIRSELAAEEHRHQGAMELIQMDLNKVTDELEKHYGK